MKNRAVLGLVLVLATVFLFLQPVGASSHVDLSVVNDSGDLNHGEQFNVTVNVTNQATESKNITTELLISNQYQYGGIKDVSADIINSTLLSGESKNLTLKWTSDLTGNFVEDGGDFTYQVNSNTSTVSGTFRVSPVPYEIVSASIDRKTPWGKNFLRPLDGDFEYNNRFNVTVRNAGVVNTSIRLEPSEADEDDFPNKNFPNRSTEYYVSGYTGENDYSCRKDPSVLDNWVLEPNETVVLHDCTLDIDDEYSGGEIIIAIEQQYTQVDTYSFGTAKTRSQLEVTNITKGEGFEGDNITHTISLNNTGGLNTSLYNSSHPDAPTSSDDVKILVRDSDNPSNILYTVTPSSIPSNTSVNFSFDINTTFGNSDITKLEFVPKFAGVDHQLTKVSNDYIYSIPEYKVEYPSTLIPGENFTVSLNSNSTAPISYISEDSIEYKYEKINFTTFIPPQMNYTNEFNLTTDKSDSGEYNFQLLTNSSLPTREFPYVLFEEPRVSPQIKDITQRRNGRNNIDISYINFGSLTGDVNVSVYINGALFVEESLSVDTSVTEEYIWDLDDMKVGTNNISVKATTQRNKKEDYTAKDSTTFNVPEPSQISADISEIPNKLNQSKIEDASVKIQVYNLGDAMDTQKVTLYVNNESLDSREINVRGGETVSYNVDLTSDVLSSGTNTVEVVTAESSDVSSIEVFEPAEGNVGYIKHEIIAGSLFVDARITNSGGTAYKDEVILRDSSGAPVDKKAIEVPPNSSIQKTLVWENINLDKEVLSVSISNDDFELEVEKDDDSEPTIAILGNTGVSDFYLGITGLVSVFVIFLSYLRYRRKDDKIIGGS